MSGFGYEQTSSRPKLTSACHPTSDVAGVGRESPLLTHSRSTGDRQQGEERLAETYGRSRAGRAWDVHTALESLGAVGGRRSRVRLENGGPKTAVSCRTAETCQTTRLRRIMKPSPARPMPNSKSVLGSGTSTSQKTHQSNSSPQANFDPGPYPQSVP